MAVGLGGNFPEKSSMTWFWLTFHQSPTNSDRSLLPTLLYIHRARCSMRYSKKNCSTIVQCPLSLTKSFLHLGRDPQLKILLLPTTAFAFIFPVLAAFSAKKSGRASFFQSDMSLSWCALRTTPDTAAPWSAPPAGTAGRSWAGRSCRRCTGPPITRRRRRSRARFLKRFGGRGVWA